MPNKHIDEFLDYYTKLPNPQYAVLLKGKWGSGKTHYINEYKNKNKQKYIYVSLYGVTSYDEIETKFLQATNPEIFNEKTIYVSKLANALISEKIRGSLKEIKKSLLSLNAKERILIFDDIERCSLKIVDLLGHINNFVEHQSYKVILIANEKELNKTKKYKKIKEKLVGKTFEFKTNPDLAYDSFLTELENDKSVKENILKKEKSNILELFEKSHSNNLRFLRQNLLDFERFHNEVLIEHYKKEEIIKDILYWFFLFSFEIRQGNNEVLDLLNDEKNSNFLSLFSFKKKEELSSLNKYRLDDNSNVIIPIVQWKEILLNSNIQKESINEALKNSKYYINDNTPSWKKLIFFHNLTDDEFIVLLKDVFKKFKSNDYKDYKHFKLVASMLLYFQEKELLVIEFEKLFDLAKKNFKLLFDEGIICIEDIYIIENVDFSDSYENIAYFECGNFEKLKNHVNEVLEEKKILKQKEDSKKIILAIKEKNRQLVLDLLDGMNNRGKIDYRYKPILNKINIDELFNALIKADGLTMHYFGGIIKDRYCRGQKVLIEEDTFLKKLLKKSKEYIKENKGKLSTYNLNEQIIENLKIALSKIEEIKKAK